MNLQLSRAEDINPKYFIGAKPHTHQGDLRQLHPAIVKRLVPCRTGSTGIGS